MGYPTYYEMFAHLMGTLKNGLDTIPTVAIPQGNEENNRPTYMRAEKQMPTKGTDSSWFSNQNTIAVTEEHIKPPHTETVVLFLYFCSSLQYASYLEN